MKLKFYPTTIFRETPKVTFFDAGIESTNGCDVVMHSGEAISPPNEFEYEKYYVHNHQIDHNLVKQGGNTNDKFNFRNSFLDNLNFISWIKV